MIELPKLHNRRWRCEMRASERFGQWAWSFEIVGAKGGVNFHVTGPHRYDNTDHWSAGLEYHSATPRDDEPPDHGRCWLTHRPCWHDGTSLYAQERYLPMWHRGDVDGIFRSMMRDADRHFYPEAADELP